MSDVKIKTNGTFSELYQSIESVRGEENIKGSKVLYLKNQNTTDETTTVSTTSFWAGQAGREASTRIYDAIKEEYGELIAMSVFKRVTGRQDANNAKVSLDKLRALRKLLRYEHKQESHRGKGIKPATFTRMREKVEDLKTKRTEYGQGDFKPGKHLRFTAKNGLYVHTGRSTGFKNMLGLQTSRRIKRLEAGQKIWWSIANEYGGDVATGIFKDAFGLNAFENRGPALGTELTINNFEDIEQAYDTFERAKEVLEKISVAPAASPLDIAAALFGPNGDNDTEAALDRLGKALPDDVVQTLRDRPQALLEYMGDKDRIFSLLERSTDEKTAKDAWHLVYGNRRARRILPNMDILKLHGAAHILKTKTSLETMKLTQAASPLDVAAALYGKKGDDETKAALKRLEKALPDDVFRTLLQRPKTFAAHMRQKDRIFSLLARSSDDKTAKGAWHDVFGDREPAGQKLKAKDIRKLREAVQLRTEYSDTVKFLEDMVLSDKASPLDVAAALFGRKGDRDTEAALKRLEKVLPNDMFKTVRERPHAVLTYMGQKDRIYSLLVRSSNNKIAAEAWYDVFGLQEPSGQTLTARDILKLRMKVQFQTVFSDALKHIDSMKTSTEFPPFDVAIALFGPQGDGGKNDNTEAALKRLENVLPKQVVQILRERPKALVAHMRNRDRIHSLLTRSFSKAAVDEAWSEHFDNKAPHTLSVRDILKVGVAAQIRHFYSLVPSELRSDKPSKPGLQPGISYFDDYDAPLPAPKYRSIVARLTSMKLVTQDTSPLDVMAALFGPQGDADENGDTEAALKRLEKVLSEKAVRTLRRRPKGLVHYMSRSDQVFSQLKLSVGESLADEVWREVIGDADPRDSYLEPEHILALRVAAQTRMQRSVSRNEARSSEVLRPGISYLQPVTTKKGNKRIVAQMIGVSKDDVRAYEDLMRIQAILTGAENARKQKKGGGTLPDATASTLAVRLGEIRAQFRERLDQLDKIDKRAKKDRRVMYTNELNRVFAPYVPRQPGHPFQLMQTWQAKLDEWQSLRRILAALQTIDKAKKNEDISGGMDLETAEEIANPLILKAGGDVDACWEVYAPKLKLLDKEVDSAQAAYQNHPWTKGMVRDYGDLGFKNTMFYNVDWTSEVEKSAPQPTKKALNDAIDQANDLAMQLEDMSLRTEKSEVTGKPPGYPLPDDWSEYEIKKDQ